jgi:hypothetical protein
MKRKLSEDEANSTNYVHCHLSRGFKPVLVPIIGGLSIRGLEVKSGGGGGVGVACMS